MNEAERQALINHLHNATLNARLRERLSSRHARDGRNNDWLNNPSIVRTWGGPRVADTSGRQAIPRPTFSESITARPSMHTAGTAVQDRNVVSSASHSMSPRPAVDPPQFPATKPGCPGFLPRPWGPPPLHGHPHSPQPLASLPAPSPLPSPSAVSKLPLQLPASANFNFSRLYEQSLNEPIHPNQQEFLESVQRIDLATTRPDQFLDTLTQIHNASFRPAQARVYDMLFMQALLFDGNRILLVSPKNGGVDTWAPPQAMWDADTLPQLPNATIHHTIMESLSRVSGLIPPELVAAISDRSDTVLQATRQDGKTAYGWSVAQIYEIRLDMAPPQIYNSAKNEIKTRWFTEAEVRSARSVDSVWKRKILAVFEMQRKTEMQLLQFGEMEMQF